MTSPKSHETLEACFSKT